MYEVYRERGTRMSNAQKVTVHRNAILEIAAKHGARNVRLFGSVARGRDHERSDIDLLVELELGRSLLDLGGLWWDLQQLLGVEVDVVTERSLEQHLRARVLQEAVPL